MKLIFTLLTELGFSLPQATRLLAFVVREFKALAVKSLDLLVDK
jgi:hypothetical protein